MKYIIIGGGILGASTAFHLAKKGEDVKIVDRRDAGQATRAGAGIVCPWLTNRSNDAWYQLVLGGAKYYPELIYELRNIGIQHTGYTKVGAINIFDTEEKLDRKVKVALNRKNEAPEIGEISRLSRQETKAYFPPVAEHYRALHISGGARVNGHAVSGALRDGALMYGADYLEGDARINDSGRVFLNGKEIETDYVVVTNGAWMNQLFKPLGMESKITYEKAQIIHLQMPTADTSNWPVMLPPYNHYQLAFENGRVVVGATKEEGRNYDSRVTVGGVQELLDKALRVSPGLSAATFLGAKVGFRPFTPGSIPAIGPVPGLEKVWIANGLGASGLTSGPYIGAQLAAHLRGDYTKLNLINYPVEDLFN